MTGTTLAALDARVFGHSAVSYLLTNSERAL